MMTLKIGSCTQSFFPHSLDTSERSSISPICEAYIQDLFNQFTHSQVHHFVRWLLGVSVQSCKKVRTITFSFWTYKTRVRAFHKSYHMNTMGTRSFLGVKSGRGVMLTPHPLLAPWSWKCRAIPLLPLWAVRLVQSLSAWTRVHFTVWMVRT
jgi:hypothetical protein